MNNKKPVVQHKIGDAVLTEQGVSQLASWQEYDNQYLNNTICIVLKAVSFIACAASVHFEGEEKEEAMQHIINLSETSKMLEVFKK